MTKEAWVDKLSQVLLAIQTTNRIATGQTHLFVTYRVEAMSPVKMGLPSPCRIHFNEISNDELMRYELDFLEEMRDESQAYLVVY